MKKVFFFCPNHVGHLYKIIILKNYYDALGYECFIAGSIELLPFAIQNKLNLYPLSSKTFLSSRKIKNKNKFSIWKSKLLNRWSDKAFVERKEELFQLFKKHNPEIIFIDTFLAADFVVWANIDINSRIIFLETMFPKNFSKTIPPLSTYSFPSIDAEKIWKKYLCKLKIRQLSSLIKYFGRSKLEIQKKYLKQAGVYAKHKIISDKVPPILFENVEEWILLPEELDFEVQALKPWQRYVGFILDKNKKEKVSDSLENFLIQHKNDEIIYVSFGTVYKGVHFEKFSKLKSADVFYDKIIQIAKNNPKLAFVVKKDDVVGENLTENILWLSYAPQQFILSKASIFVTHCGGNSIFESVSNGVPMLLMPFDDGWEKMGNAARMVFHGLGLKANFTDSVAQIESLLLELIQNKQYENKVKVFAEIMNAKYSFSYWDEVLK